MASKTSMEQFLLLSVILTGYSKADLLSTGLSQQYYDKLSSIVDGDLCGRLWTATEKVLRKGGDHPERIERNVRVLLFRDPAFAPLAANIIKMWYLGSWCQLPQGWRHKYGAKAEDVDHVISAEAYQEGLIWNAIGSHPQGAKQPGFGSWSLPPPQMPRLKRKGRRRR